MSLTLDDNQSLYQIRAYKPGTIQVNQDIYNNSIIVSAKQLISPWKPQTITELCSTDLDAITVLHPTILLIGTGEHLLFPSLDIYGDLINKGIGVEIMNTNAACRTFNILTSENRDVVAALIVK